ncbi:MAG TPA: hypothetical protein VI462_13395 [Acidimicrobiia bacterium]
MRREGVDRLTLDTNVVWDLWRDDAEWRDAVEQLLALSQAGDVDLVVTRYVHDDVPGGQLGDRLASIHELGIGTTAFKVASREGREAPAQLDGHEVDARLGQWDALLPRATPDLKTPAALVKVRQRDDGIHHLAW